MFTNKSILITGGSGSLGQELTKQLLMFHKPRRIVILSRDDHKHAQMQAKFNDQKNILRFWIGDIRDYDRLKMAFNGIDYIFHCAALKHVDRGEDNPIEYKRTIVDGAEAIIKAALECGVKRVVALSTDKATAPFNTYGACKLLSDKLFLSANRYSGDSGTKFSVIRYGNVLGSNGSVTMDVNRKDLTIYDRTMTRFWITLPYAAYLVTQLMLDMKGGELMIPRIPSMNVYELLKIANPKAKFIDGELRNGEKLHESMITSDDARLTYEFDKFYIVYQNTYTETPIFGQELGYKVDSDFSYTSDSNSWYLTKGEAIQMLQGFMPDIR